MNDLTQFTFFIQTTLKFHLTSFEKNFEIDVPGKKRSNFWFRISLNRLKIFANYDILLKLFLKLSYIQCSINSLLVS